MRLRVVLADDNPGVLQMLSKILGTTVEVVATAIDGNSALQFIREFKPDVAVLDLEMPGLTGIEVTKELREHPPSPAVVICSVHRDQQLVEAALEAGALGYVFKPDCARNLLLAVETVARGLVFHPFVPPDNGCGQR
jgi:DNA-binding NarL/FixJ family response regulator